MRPLGACTSIICLMIIFAEAKHCMKLIRMLLIRDRNSTDLVKEDTVTRLRVSLKACWKPKEYITRRE
jgi:hypothetical protein